MVRHESRAGNNLLNPRPKKLFNCKRCTAVTTNGTYCSNECKVEHNWDIKIAEAKDSGMAPSHQMSAKRLILRIKGHKCEICSVVEWMGQKAPLVMDHINGNSGDWRIENLRLVCGNCDMQLPTYKSKNIGNGRMYNRKYMSGRANRLGDENRLESGSG